jgi:hypothetical protein
VAGHFKGLGDLDPASVEALRWEAASNIAVATTARSPCCQANHDPGNGLIAGGVAWVGYHRCRRPGRQGPAEEHHLRL